MTPSKRPPSGGKAAAARPKPAKAAARPKAARTTIGNASSKAVVAEAVAATPAGAGEAIRPWRLALVLALAVAGLARLAPVLRLKSSQLVAIVPSGPMIPQGMEPGQLGQMVALNALPDGSLCSLSRNNEHWRVQRFNADLSFTAKADFDAKALGELVDLAARPDGGAWLAAKDGRLWRVDPKLKLQGLVVASGAKRVKAMCLQTGGDLVLVDGQDGQLLRLDADGRPRAQQALSGADDVKSLAPLADGGVAMLEAREQTGWIRIFDAQLRQTARFVVPELFNGEPLHLGASGKVLVINDLTGPRGLIFMSVDGHMLGSALGGSNFLFTHPGLVAGDPRGQVAYVHFIPGLMRFSLPFGDRP